MDTLSITHLQELLSQQDTLLLKMVEVQQDIGQIKSEGLWFKLLPFFGVIVGGLLTYWGQYLLKNKDIQISRYNDLSEFTGRIFRSITTLNFLLRELAYLEVDSKYQHQLSCKETGDAQKRALEEHYNDYKFIAENRAKIASAIAELQAAFIAYYKCKNEKMPAESSTKLHGFADHILNLKRHTEYPEELEITAEILANDIAQMKMEYTRNIAGIQDMANGL